MNELSKQLETPSLDLFGIGKKSNKDRPLLNEVLQESHKKNSAEIQELKKTIETRKQIYDSMLRYAHTYIMSTGFAGKEKIQVQKIKNSTTTINLKTSMATIQLDLHYNELNETNDSLRKNTNILPLISITGSVDGTHYTLEDYTIEDAVRIGSELLKHIERKKDPKSFGYTEIRYFLQDNNQVLLIGRKPGGEIKKIDFFGYVDDVKGKLNLYAYMSHYFGVPVDPEILEEGSSNPAKKILI